MPTRKKAPPAPPPLTDGDVADLRTKVGAGERPRVVIRTASASVPAGTRGNVIRVGSPSDGEFIVVRLGRDEVPFAPTELGLTTRGRAAAAAPEAPARSAAPARKRAGTAAAKPGKPAKAATPTPAKRSAKVAAAKGGGRGRSRRSPHPLTVTLRFADGGWTVEAHRGSRRLARASAVRPGAVKAFADLVDDDTVRDALTETVESCRAVVEERAQKLRAELQAAEASLREYESRRR